MSNLSGLPPAPVIHSSIKNMANEIAVRLITLPDALGQNSQPLKLTGTVIGQKSDGSVQVQTDKGIIGILLKDRAGLRTGQNLEIEIPAGRPPQQATIKQASPSTAPAQTLAQTIEQSDNPASVLPSSTNASALKLDRNNSIKPNEIQTALESVKETIKLNTENLLKNTAPLQAGQNLRLIPIPPQTANQLPAPIPSAVLLTALIDLIKTLSPKQTELQSNLIQALTKLDISSLIDKNSAPRLTAQIQTLIQNFIGPETTENKFLQPTSTTPGSFNPAKSLDIRVVAFASGDFQTALNNAQNAKIAFSAQNFFTVPLQNSSSSTPTPSLSFLGQVSGFTAQGQPVLTLSLPGSGIMQSYIAQFPTSNLSVGSPLVLNLISNPTEFGRTAPAQLSDWIKSGTWTHLDDLIQTLAQVNPNLGQNLTQILPSSAQPQNAGPLTALFLALMRSGDIESFITAPALNLLRQAGKLDSLRALNNDISFSNRLENTTLPQDWRAVLLPFYHDQQLYKLPLFYKNFSDENEKEQKKRNKMMRFLFDLRLSRMGDVQVDGFLQAQRLDMILRTKSAISVPMQSALKQTYTKALERSNLNGEMSFQFKPEQWVDIELPLDMNMISA